MPSNICLIPNTPSAYPRRTPPFAPAQPSAAAPRGAQTELSAPCPCLHTGARGHGRHRQEVAQGGTISVTRCSRHSRSPDYASGLLNLPSAAPHVPPFRPGPAERGLTLPGKAGAAARNRGALPQPEAARSRDSRGLRGERWARLPAASPPAPPAPHSAGRGIPPAWPEPRWAAGASGRLLHTAEKMRRWKTPGVGSGLEQSPSGSVRHQGRLPHSQGSVGPRPPHAGWGQLGCKGMRRRGTPGTPPRGPLAAEAGPCFPLPATSSWC